MCTGTMNIRFNYGGEQSVPMHFSRRIRKPRATTPAYISRTFVVPINFGQGVYKDDGKQQFRKEQSDSQRKAAELQLEQITHSTNRLLNLDTTGKTTLQPKEVELLSNEVRVALGFWSSKWIVHHHPFCTIYPTHVKGLRYDEQSNKKRNIERSDEYCYGDYGPKQAEKLLDWILEMDKAYPQHNFLERILCESGTNTANAVFANIIDAYLLPCTTGKSSTHITDDFTQYSSSTGSHNVNLDLWRPSISDACRIIDMMNNLIGGKRTTFEHDTNTNNSILYTWVKLSTLLGLDSSLLGKVSTMQSSNGKKCINGDDSVDLSNRSEASSSKMGSVNEVLNAMELKLLEMEERYFQSGKESLKPDILSYNHVVRGVIGGPNGAERAEWYLRRMERTEDRYLGIVTDEEDTDEDTLPITTVFADEVT